LVSLRTGGRQAARVAAFRALRAIHWVHRLIQVPVLYKDVHSLHHRNIKPDRVVGYLDASGRAKNT
jgi:hypothetical protein